MESIGSLPISAGGSRLGSPGAPRTFVNAGARNDRASVTYPYVTIGSPRTESRATTKTTASGFLLCSPNNTAYDELVSCTARFLNGPASDDPMVITSGSRTGPSALTYATIVSRAH